MICRTLILLLGLLLIGCTPAPVEEPELVLATRVVLTREVVPTPEIMPTLTPTWTVTPIMEMSTAVPMQPSSPTPLPSPTTTLLPTNTPTPSRTPMPTPVLPDLPTPATRLPNSSILAEAWVTEQFVWGVGEKGYIGYGDGRTWTQIGSPTEETLNDVAFISPDNGWAVGENSTMLHWDGTGWNLMYSYGERPYYHYILEDVEFASPTDVWAIGMVNSEGGGGGLILHWQWNGQGWVNMEVNRPYCPCPFTSILMLSETDGWVVGYSDVSAFTMHWNGTAWSVIANPYDDYPGSWLYTVRGTAPNDVWAEGVKQVNTPGRTGGPLILHWDGNEWQERQPPTREPVK